MSKSKKAKSALPKRIAGVKVPKAVRRGRFADLLASRQGQALIAEAILGAGAIATTLKAKKAKKAGPALRSAKTGLAEAGDLAASGLSTASSTLAYALSEAARAFAEALRNGGPAEPRSFSADAEAEVWTPDYGAPEPAAKPKAARAKPGTSPSL